MRFSASEYRACVSDRIRRLVADGIAMKTDPAAASERMLATLDELEEALKDLHARTEFSEAEFARRAEKKREKERRAAEKKLQEEQREKERREKEQREAEAKRCAEEQQREKERREAEAKRRAEEQREKERREKEQREKERREEAERAEEKERQRKITVNRRRFIGGCMFVTFALSGWLFFNASRNGSNSGMSYSVVLIVFELIICAVVWK